MASTEAHAPESRVPLLVPILWLVGSFAAAWAGWQDLSASEGGTIADSCLIPGSNLPIPLIWLPASLGPSFLLLSFLRNREYSLGTGPIFGGLGILVGCLGLVSLWGGFALPCHPLDLPLSLLFVGLSAFSIALALRGPRLAPAGLGLLASVFLWITFATVVSEASRVGSFLLRPAAVKSVGAKRPSDGRTLQAPQPVDLVVGLRDADIRVVPPERRRNAPIEVGDPQIGPQEALVTVVLIDDPTRPGAEHWLDLLDQLQEAYRHEVRFAYKPMVPGGVCSADPKLVEACAWTRTLICLTEEGLAWDALDVRAEHTVAAGLPHPDQLLTVLGLSPNKLERCLGSNAPDTMIKRNYAAWKMARAESLPYLDVEGFGFGGERPDRAAIVTMIEGLLQRRPPPQDGAIVGVDLTWRLGGGPTGPLLPRRWTENGREFLGDAHAARETCLANGLVVCSAQSLREACRGRVGDSPARRSPFARFNVRPDCPGNGDCEAWWAHFQLVEPGGEWVDQGAGNILLRQNQGDCSESLISADASLMAPFRCCAGPG